MSTLLIKNGKIIKLQMTFPTTSTKISFINCFPQFGILSQYCLNCFAIIFGAIKEKYYYKNES